MPKHLEDALAHISGDEATIISDLDRLIAIDTSFPPGDGYEAFASACEEMVQPSGFACDRVSVPGELWQTENGPARGERINLIARRRTGRPVCSIYYHVDTVPAGDGWTRDPFALTVEGDRLYGRGTADMKGSIAATLAAIRAADAVGIELAYDPSLLFCTDEEGGLYPGIRYLAEQGLVEGHLLSFNGGAAPRIWAGCFGSIDLEISIKGLAAHSGESTGKGINAIEEAIPLLNAFLALKAQVEQRVSALPPPPANGGRPLNARLTVTAAHGGAKGSSVPGHFKLVVNRRYAPEERYEDVRAELETTIARAMAGSRARGVTHRMVGHLSPVVDPTGPHWPAWIEALSHGFGWPVESFSKWGASSSSDMGWVQDAGIHEILLGGLIRPDSAAHAADEHATLGDVRSLARSILFYLAGARLPSTRTIGEPK
ncbi:M20/M25/M40 family metallo-hydrolase [Chelativorans sp. AA-79]|uniref:M20 family metallopeptidase n=1 Tax=Chelativorans sp. AA-79 TaxID=3028735 RepID=UPI0023F9AE75|nr:M20/M25/M40 family metallo-hydrolase [Chelativorans sp. AA-79]WEX09675.1 M20/M25/M40 family metallo-hydrolase [Chelativorans sp. AA-79]